MDIAFKLFIIILVTYGFSKLARRFHLSEVIGMIVAGLLLTIPLAYEHLILGHEAMVNGLATAGLITLMFLAGFEVSGNLLFKEEKDAIVVTLFTLSASLLIGTIVFTLLGFGLPAAIIMGICFGVTAEGTKARVLLQLKKLKTKLGALLMGTGIINDIIGVFLLLFVSYIFTHGFQVSELFTLFAVLLAFFAGMMAHYSLNRFSAKLKRIERLLLFTLVPFFFVNMGIKFDFHSLKLDPWILLVVLLTATLSQIIGVFLTKPITKLRLKQLFLVGWGMNSKGAVELAIAYIALNIGLLPPTLYSSLVVTALVSTILFQIIIFRMVKKNPGIMD